ncbi:MAG TPA: Fic family protein [Candidatus Acidoferrum sp.]|nr:Fic family protein [Candidatus Acidoferrum sp.]
MTLVIREIKGKKYYYSSLSYFLISKSRSFSKYIGAKKPAEKELDRLENQFKDQIMTRLSGKQYTAESIEKNEVIRTLLFRDLFREKYKNLTESKKRKYDIDSTVLFTLTTLTTEDVDVNIEDVRNALKKDSALTKMEQISKNMLNAVDLIKQPRILDKKYLLELHKTAMSSFESKNPGQIREKQVYLYKMNQNSPIGAELSYRPPSHTEVSKLLDSFIAWYKNSSLNPIEKATVAHYKLYKIHPFLDGNKRMARLIFNKTLLDEGFPLLNVSIEKEKYFEALIESVEKNQVKVLVEFTLRQYYKQVKDFLAET